jgi:serine/threonine protein kinase
VQTLDKECVGEGKFSVVFKAQKISDGSEVALKLIKVIVLYQ